MSGLNRKIGPVICDIFSEFFIIVFLFVFCSDNTLGLVIIYRMKVQVGKAEKGHKRERLRDK